MKPKIQMLLDVENIFGESTKGLGRFVLCLILIFSLPVFLIWSTLFTIIPIPIQIIVCLFWAIRVLLIVMGREHERMIAFNKQCNDIYSLSNDLININSIHPQGCIEYVNGNIGFFVVVYNDSSKDTLLKSKQINNFLNLLVGTHSFDIYVQNINDTTALDAKYLNVKLFADTKAAKDFMEIIDYNRENVIEHSLLTKNVIFVKGNKYQWKEILSEITSALSSESARVFQRAYLVTNMSEIVEILSRDIDGYIDIEEMLMKKYYTGNTYGSYVISYDYEDIKQAKIEDGLGFLGG